MQLLLRQQPVARDLRTVSAALRMISDMERIGDQAADIAEITRFIADSPLTSRVSIAEMARSVIGMGDSGEVCIDLLMIAKYLERIGDHAVNIAEWVEYSLTGHHADLP